VPPTSCSTAALDSAGTETLPTTPPPETPLDPPDSAQPGAKHSEPASNNEAVASSLLVSLEGGTGALAPSSVAKEFPQLPRSPDSSCSLRCDSAEWTGVTSRRSAKAAAAAAAATAAAPAENGGTKGRKGAAAAGGGGATKGRRRGADGNAAKSRSSAEAVTSQNAGAAWRGTAGGGDSRAVDSAAHADAPPGRSPATTRLAAPSVEAGGAVAVGTPSSVRPQGPERASEGDEGRGQSHPALAPGSLWGNPMERPRQSAAAALRPIAHLPLLVPGQFGSLVRSDQTSSTRPAEQAPPAAVGTQPLSTAHSGYGEDESRRAWSRVSCGPSAATGRSQDEWSSAALPDSHAGSGTLGGEGATDVFSAWGVVSQTNLPHQSGVHAAGIDTSCMSQRGMAWAQQGWVQGFHSRPPRLGDTTAGTAACSSNSSMAAFQAGGHSRGSTRPSAGQDWEAGAALQRRPPGCDSEQQLFDWDGAPGTGRRGLPGSGSTQLREEEVLLLKEQLRAEMNVEMDGRMHAMMAQMSRQFALTAATHNGCGTAERTAALPTDLVHEWSGLGWGVAREGVQASQGSAPGLQWGEGHWGSQGSELVCAGLGVREASMWTPLGSVGVDAERGNTNWGVDPAVDSILRHALGDDAPIESLWDTTSPPRGTVATGAHDAAWTAFGTGPGCNGAVAGGSERELTPWTAGQEAPSAMGSGGRVW
jgi:hypothetical protein